MATNKTQAQILADLDTVDFFNNLVSQQVPSQSGIDTLLNLESDFQNSYYEAIGAENTDAGIEKIRSNWDKTTHTPQNIRDMQGMLVNRIRNMSRSTRSDLQIMSENEQV